MLVGANTTISELGRLLAERPGLAFRLEVRPGMTGGARFRVVTDGREIAETWLLAATLNHALEMHDRGRTVTATPLLLEARR
jgi:hypothetical protein